MDTSNKIKDILTKTFSPEKLDIIDESYKHVGHPGAREGGGHFEVIIVSQAFINVKSLQRHRMVYDALSDMIKTKQIHALSIKAHIPESQ